MAAIDRTGLLNPGVVWEIKPPCVPRTGFLDGSITVDFQEWHFHFASGSASPLEVAQVRLTARAELYRRLNPEGQSTSWEFRPFNGAGQQQITVLPSNPHLGEHQAYMEEPDSKRLCLWDRQGCLTRNTSRQLALSSISLNRRVCSSLG